MTVGFAEGLKATNPDAMMLYSVIGEAAYDDAAGAKRVTEQQLAADADVIFGMGDGASFGMLQAIEEHNAQEGANKAWFIDVIGDKKAEHGDALLSSVLFDYTGIYNQMLDDLSAGTFGDVYTMDVKKISRPARSATSTPWMSRTAAFACSSFPRISLRTPKMPYPMPSRRLSMARSRSRLSAMPRR
jgi:hypothetical protein